MILYWLAIIGIALLIIVGCDHYIRREAWEEEEKRAAERVQKAREKADAARRDAWNKKQVSREYWDNAAAVRKSHQESVAIATAPRPADPLASALYDAMGELGNAPEAVPSRHTLTGSSWVSDACPSPASDSGSSGSSGSSSDCGSSDSGCSSSCGD